MVVTGEIQEAKRESLATWVHSRGYYVGNSAFFRGIVNNILCIGRKGGSKSGNL